MDLGSRDIDHLTLAVTALIAPFSVYTESAIWTEGAIRTLVDVGTSIAAVVALRVIHIHTLVSRITKRIGRITVTTLVATIDIPTGVARRTRGIIIHTFIDVLTAIAAMVTFGGTDQLAGIARVALDEITTRWRKS